MYIREELTDAQVLVPMRMEQYWSDMIGTWYVREDVRVLLLASRDRLILQRYHLLFEPSDVFTPRLQSVWIIFPFLTLEIKVYIPPMFTVNCETLSIDHYQSKLCCRPKRFRSQMSSMCLM